jgi:E3 ubiquitin-protein ligase TRIP12
MFFRLTAFEPERIKYYWKKLFKNKPIPDFL